MILATFRTSHGAFYRKKMCKCIRANPRFDETLMAPLPGSRLQFSRPFTITGVDFAGSFIVRNRIRRIIGKKTWIAIFVCFTTRAVHLETVEDMTSSSFLASLRRFMSRRGRYSVIYSDNGTNFVGLKES